MSRVLVERPRVGRSWARGTSHESSPRNLDEAPKRGPKRLKRTKVLNENLAPLRRYLKRQVGRTWNDVYSEISKQLRPSNAVQQHVRDHLLDFVCLRVHFINGLPTEAHRERYRFRFWYLYVCPNTGLLCECRSDRKHDRKSWMKTGCHCPDCASAIGEPA